MADMGFEIIIDIMFHVVTERVKEYLLQSRPKFKSKVVAKEVFYCWFFSKMYGVIN
jgi:hypothetical protein